MRENIAAKQQQKSQFFIAFSVILTFSFNTKKLLF
jgi:hypothetical protein